MKEKRKFSGEFITEMESLQVLGGSAQPMNTNIGYKCITDNCNNGNCVQKCGCIDVGCGGTTDPCSSINSSGGKLPWPMRCAQDDRLQ